MTIADRIAKALVDNHNAREIKRGHAILVWDAMPEENKTNAYEDAQAVIKALSEGVAEMLPAILNK